MTQSETANAEQLRAEIDRVAPSVQRVRDEVGKVLIRVVPGQQFEGADEEEIRGKVAECVGPGLDLAFEYVDDIPPTARGKHVFVKQSLALPSTWAGE